METSLSVVPATVMCFVMLQQYLYNEMQYRDRSKLRYRFRRTSYINTLIAEWDETANRDIYPLTAVSLPPLIIPASLLNDKGNGKLRKSSHMLERY